jgi:hypothetical protein
VSMPLLVRHPAPYPTESILGYVLRLSEKNGYLSPWSVYHLAGMKQKEMKTTGIRVEKLAPIASCPISELTQIAFTSARNRRLPQLLGHRLTPTDLNVAQPKLCPQCVAEKGFIEAHWHLELMVACPVHECLTISECPKCGKRLRWFRPGLLECECGANLLEYEMPAIPQPEASLLDLIRMKVFGHCADEENPVSLPHEDLLAMTLRSMLTVIRALAKHRLVADDCTSPIGLLQIILAASRVLMDWPKNFIALLTDLGQKLPADVSGGVGKQFEGIYQALFRNTAIGPPENTDFLRIAFLDFAMNHWGRGFVDHKLIKKLGDVGPKRYLTQTEFAAQIGVQQSTAARLLKGSKLSSRRVKCGKADRILVDANQGAIPYTFPGKIYRKREAAKRLGISVSVLHALKEGSIYEVNHLLPTRAGFHELDLDAFRQRVLALVPDNRFCSIAGVESVTLNSVLCGHHDSTKTKVKLVRALLAKDIAVFGNADGTIGGLLLDRFGYRQFIVDARSGAAGNAKTPGEVARQLSCDPEAVAALVRLGLLQNGATPVGLRIADESVTAFRREYISLAAIAKAEQTSSRALMRRCGDRGISMLLVPMKRRGPQPFIRVVDHQSSLCAP